MPTITLGPNMGRFSDVAHQLEAERLARVQQQIETDRIAADAAQHGASLQAQQERMQQDQAQFDAQQARLMFQDEMNNQFKSAEQQRLQEGQNREFGANTLDQSIKTGVTLDESGKNYRPLVEGDPAWQAHQDYQTQKTAAVEQQKATLAATNQERLATQRLTYAKAGFAIDEPAPGQWVPRPLDPQNPADAPYVQFHQQFLDEQTAKAPLSPEERIRVAKETAEANAAARAPEQKAASIKELTTEIRNEDNDIRQLEKALKPPQDILALQAQLKGAPEKQKPALQAQIDQATRDQIAFAASQEEIADRKRYVAGLRQRRDNLAGTPAGTGPGGKPMLPPEKAVEYLKMFNGNKDLARQWATENGWAF